MSADDLDDPYVGAPVFAAAPDTTESAEAPPRAQETPFNPYTE